MNSLLESFLLLDLSLLLQLTHQWYLNILLYTNYFSEVSISRKHLKVYWYGFTFKTLIFFFKHDILINSNVSYINNVRGHAGDSKRNKIWSLLKRSESNENRNVYN